MKLYERRPEGADTKNILLQVHVVPYKGEDNKHCILQRIGQLIYGLGVEVIIGVTVQVFSFEVKYLFMVIEILNVLA